MPFPHAFPDKRPYAAKLLADLRLEHHPLPDFVAATVPFEIERLVKRGGPSELDRELTQRFAERLAEQADDLLFRSREKGKTARLFADLVRAVAVLAFSPGGVTVFGTHYKAPLDLQD